jgi:hypothetical protein
MYHMDGVCLQQPAEKTKMMVETEELEAAKKALVSSSIAEDAQRSL